jgi:hypothetical protein
MVGPVFRGAVPRRIEARLRGSLAGSLGPNQRPRAAILQDPHRGFTTFGKCRDFLEDSIFQDVEITGCRAGEPVAWTP